MMKLEPANIVCPTCGNGNYMHHLIGKNVGYWDMKCLNCNSYFNFDELYKRHIGEVLKPKPVTNGDKIRSMTDEELADWLGIYCNGQTAQEVGKPCVSGMGSCEECWLDWLKQECEQ